MANPEVNNVIGGTRPDWWLGDLAMMSIVGFGLGVLTFGMDLAGQQKREAEDAKLRALIRGIDLPDDLRLYCCWGG